MREDQKKEAPGKENGDAPEAEPQATSTIRLPMEIPEVAREVLDKIEGLTIEELVFRKGDSTLAIRPSRIISDALSIVPSKPATPSKEAREAKKQPVESKAKKTTPEEKPAAAESAAYKKTIDAPFVGVLYLTPGPGKESFVKEGDVVEEGGKLCIVEAMKLFNEITAPRKCRVVKILGIHGQAVEKGQPLIGIEEL